MAARWRGEGGQHQGTRPYQEDSWALKTLNDGALLAVVADGMGGHAGGSVASRLVAEAMVKAVEQGRSLADGLHAANAAVQAGAAGKADLAGMGSTVVVGQSLELIDEGTRRLPPNARLLLCSDGVLSLGDADIVSQSANPVSSLISAVLAVRNPHQDNVTVIKLERTS